MADGLLIYRSRLRISPIVVLKILDCWRVNGKHISLGIWRMVDAYASLLMISFHLGMYI